MSRQGWVVALGALALAMALGFWFLRAERVPAEDARAASERVIEPATQWPTGLEQPAPRPDARKDAAPELPVQAASPVATPLELLVISDEGTAVDGARILIFRKQEILAAGATDAEGLARFPSGAGKAEVAIFAASWPVLRAPIVLDPGRQALTLVRGAILGGRVLVDGAVPAAPLALYFAPDPDPKETSSFPSSVVARLKSLLANGNNDSARNDLRFQFTRTDGSGTFLFRGLDQEKSGGLTWDGPYVIDQPDDSDSVWNINSLRIGAPRSDVELLLTRGIELALRVVDPDGLAVPGASVVLSIAVRSPRGSSESFIRGEADGEGRFRALVGRRPPTGVTVSIARSTGAGLVVHELTCPDELRGIWDVGDLALQATRTIRLHVQDSLGAPIVGASAASLPSGLTSKQRSNDQGDFELSMRPGDNQFLVQALGYENATDDVLPEATEGLATLTRACLLVFTLPEIAGVDRRRLSVSVTGDPPIFKDELSGSPKVFQDVGLSSSSERDELGTSRYETSNTSDGRWKIAGLMPGTALEARLEADDGSVVSKLVIEPLSAGEHRTIELAVDRRPRSLRIHLQDPDQSPVGGARVVLIYNAQGSGKSAREGVRGTYKILALYAERFPTLRIEADGFPTKVLHGITLPPLEITVVLDPPRALEVELVHLDGSPVLEEARISAGASSLSMKQGKPTSPGHWIVNELPAGEVAIHVEGNVGSLDCLHDMSVPYRKLALGEKGCVMAWATIQGDQQDREWSISICSAGDTKALARKPISQASFNGLAFGSYDLWLEQRAARAPWEWTRVGSTTRAVLDANQPKIEIDMTR
ncbi:MAG: carboxypeptidase-like regulatory domain-containing protein [Planctomycetota bacterium]